MAGELVGTVGVGCSILPSDLKRNLNARMSTMERKVALGIPRAMAIIAASSFSIRRCSG